MRAPLALLLAACAGLALAQQPMPTPPSSYSAVVSVNEDVGFTLAFSEYYDAATQRLRTDGRFSPSEYSQLSDLSRQVMYQWVPNDPTKPCVAISTSILPTYFFEPSRDALAAGGGVNPVYSGLSSAARTIPCDTWRGAVSFEMENIKEVGTETIYWTHSATPYPVPVRLEASVMVSRRDNASADWVEVGLQHAYIDWVYFVAETPDESHFTVPAQCRAVPVYQTWAEVGAAGASALFNISIPTTSAVKPQPTAPHVPALPSMFRLVAEAKLTTSQQTVTSMKWYMDLNNHERLDYLNDQRKTETLIYDYTRTPQIVYKITPSGCTTSTLDDANASPLYARAGALPKLFGDPSFLGTPYYTGRQPARGVAADTFMQRKRGLVNTYNLGSTFDFDINVLFYPEGWVFPGREGLSARLRLPIRVMNNGTASTLSAAGEVLTVTPYSDVWDFFQFLPTQPDGSLFDAVNNFGCNANPPQPEPTYESSKAGTIAGSIIGVLLGLALAYGGYRWWRARQQQQLHASVQGMTKAGDTASEA